MSPYDGIYGYCVFGGLWLPELLPKKLFRAGNQPAGDGWVGGDLLLRLGNVPTIPRTLRATGLRRCSFLHFCFHCGAA